MCTTFLNLGKLFFVSEFRPIAATSSFEVGCQWLGLAGSSQVFLGLFVWQKRRAKEEYKGL